MGNIESNVRKRVRKQNIQHAILSAIGVAGILAAIMVAPNTLQLLKYAPGMRRHHPSRISRSLNALHNKGLVTLKEKNGKRVAELTLAGQKVLTRLSLGQLKPPKPKRWDRQWRIVIFDIPERRRKVRDHLRMMLDAIGFLKLQESVWIYPYDCEDMLNLLRTELLIGREVLYIVAQDVEGDARLRRTFGLN